MLLHYEPYNHININGSLHIWELRHLRTATLLCNTDWCISAESVHGLMVEHAVLVVLLPSWDASARSAWASTAWASASRPCHAVVCVVDTLALSMDWHLLRPEDGHRGRKRSRPEDRTPTATPQLQAILQSINWQLRDVECMGSVTCSRLLVDLSQPERASPIPAVKEFADANAMEILDQQSEDHSDAERAIQRLLVDATPLQSVIQTFNSGGDEWAYHRCVTALYKALAQRTTVLEADERFQGRFTLNVHDAAPLNFMRMNRAAKEAFVASGDAERPSLLKMLAPSCSTKRGRQYLRQWMDRPCVDVGTLNERHDAVEAIVSAIPEGNPAHSATGSVLWLLSRLFRHFQGYERQLASFSSIADTRDTSVPYRPSLADFEDLQTWLNELQSIVKAYWTKLDEAQSLDHLHATRLRPIQDLCCRGLQPLCDLIGQVLIRTKDDGAGYFELDSTNESASNLRELRAEVRRCELEIETAVKQAATLLRLARSRIKTVFDDDEQTTFSGVGVMLRVSRQDSHRVQQQSGKGLTVFRASRASGVWFSTPAIDSLGAKWKALRQSYEAAEADLVTYLTSKLETGFAGLLGDLGRGIAELDVLVSFALVSHKQQFTRASIWDPRAVRSGEGEGHFLRLVNAFDPFTTNGVAKSGHTTESSSSHTVELCYHDGKTFLLLAGDQDANHATLLRRLGHIVLLNQLGSFVPCERAELPVFDAICLRTGAYDQQLYGFSTFMTEMQEMARIFEMMTPASLILVEDLCRGTSTTEGLALALSLCLHLMETKVTTCFSSQWQELTDQLAKQTAAVIPIQQCQISEEEGEEGEVGVCDKARGQHQSLERLMIDCDLPSDLIELVHEELHHRNTRVKVAEHLDHEDAVAIDCSPTSEG